MAITAITMTTTAAAIEATTGIAPLISLGRRCWRRLELSRPPIGAGSRSCQGEGGPGHVTFRLLVATPPPYVRTCPAHARRFIVLGPGIPRDRRSQLAARPH